MTERKIKEFVDVEHSRNGWKLDPVIMHNHDNLLFFNGGDSGKFIGVDKFGEFTIGNYHDAYENIADGCFETIFTKKFDTMKDAVKRLREVVPNLF